MSLTLAIVIVVTLDLALILGLAYVMSRAALLTPHVSSDRRDTVGPRDAEVPGRTPDAVRATRNIEVPRRIPHATRAADPSASRG